MEHSSHDGTVPRDPPFSADNALRSCTKVDADLPIALQHDDEFADATTDPFAVLARDLQTPKLDRLHKYLWTAGLMRPARPLHRQRQLNRAILITERPDEHLVWQEASIFIKPLPEYLLSHSFWVYSICPHDATLYSSALGMLLSYTWLIQSQPDLRIAHETGLIPTDVDWRAWSCLARDVIKASFEFHREITRTAHRAELQKIADDTPWRYDYGELRLSRLSRLVRIGRAGWSARNVTGGFAAGSQRYTTLFERNFGWLIVVFVYPSVVLSALQVALATARFSDDAVFQAFSYSIALATLGLVVLVALLALAVWGGLFAYHLSSTIWYNRQLRLKRLCRIDSPAVYASKETTRSEHKLSNTDVLTKNKKAQL
ncbi:DUF6601 domain-containing protein [Microdochium nivale]|nr:DUF6601 domain-containing protein [Microdochium nivale]